MTILEEILEVKKEEVNKLRQKYSVKSFSDFEFFRTPKLSLSDALSKKEKINLIAEIKKASPSKGIIKTDFDHRAIAEIYFINNADAVSILTDKKFFHGCISYLNDIAHFKTAPLLRKDFIIDEFQVLEAKANGADAVLLIAEALSKNQLSELSACAFENDLEVLLEIHSQQQIEKIDFELNKIIGINNRNLETFEVGLNTTFDLKKYIPPNTIVVSESGITSKENIDYLKKVKVNAVLVGEHFMKSKKIEDSLKQFIDWCRHEN